MRAIVITRHGGPGVLELRDVPAPAPGACEVRVDVAVAGVNYRDVYERAGQTPGEPPLIAGAEGAGTVAALGEGAGGLAIGDRVVFAAARGSYAEQAVVAVRDAVPIPDGVGEDVAASVLLQGLTAHYLCHDVYPVQVGDTILVHAGAGGVGLLLTQLAAARGGRVIATVSSDEKAELARGAGAAEAIPYEGFGARVRELTGGEGAAAAYDGVGAATFDESLACLRIRGTLALFGAASGQVPPVDPRRLMAGGSLFLTRPTLPHFVRTREELLGRAAAVLDAVADGGLDVRIGARYPLAEARRAHEDLEARRSTGKLLIDVR